MVALQTQRKQGSISQMLLVALVISTLLGTACRSSDSRRMTSENMVPTPLVLSAGDVLDITFPGATNMSGSRRIGPEGSLNMPIIGQVQAAGKTAARLEAELEELYSKELQDEEVFVNVAGSANAVYVSGSVLRPGRVTMDRPMTALEAILETGGFAQDANLKHVTVFRYEGKENVTYEIDLEPVFEGGPVSRFYLKPRDVVNVPRKTQWF